MKLYHGTPCGNFSVSGPVLRGHRMCISFAWGASSGQKTYARPRPSALAWAKNSSHVLLDCGAYSTWTKGYTFDYHAVCDWYRAMIPLTETLVLIPDVIEGSAVENDRLIELFPGDLMPFGVPVWHTVEPIARAVSLTQTFPLIAVGACGPHRAVNKPPFFDRMIDLFDALPTQRFHLLRGLQMAGGPFPFVSADSTDLGQNHSRNAERLTAARDRWDRRAALTATTWKGADRCHHKDWDSLRQTHLLAPPPPTFAPRQDHPSQTKTRRKQPDQAHDPRQINWLA